MKTIILIDGHNFLFKMFYGIPSSIKNSKGKEIRGLIGFNKIIDIFHPYALYVVFDSETSRKNNLKLDRHYKENRLHYENVKEEENPFSQLPLIQKALDYLRIPYLEVLNNETDDYIASFITQFQEGNQYIIIFNDLDFMQLLTNNVSLYVYRGKKQCFIYTGKSSRKVWSNSRKNSGMESVSWGQK